MNIGRFIKNNQLFIILSVVLGIGYFFLRLIHLAEFPLFTDEAIYLWWSQVAASEPHLRFISLVDGKQPLFVWLAIISMKLVEDPLIAGRAVSVLSGFFTMVGLGLLAYELFKQKKVAFLTMGLYLIYPFAHVYDRMALMDGMVGTFAIWAIYLSVILVRRANLAVSYTLGFILGGSMLTKSSGVLVAYMLPFSLLLFNFVAKDRLKRLIKWGSLALFAFVIAQGIYNLLRLSEFFYIIELKNSTFVYPFSEWIKNPFTNFFNNLRILTEWIIPYMNIYLFLIIAAFLSIRKYPKEIALLFVYFVLPLLALASRGLALFPRFEYSMTLSLIPLCALGFFNLENIIQRTLKSERYHLASRIVLLVLIIAYPAFVIYNLTFNPQKAYIAKADYDQYIGGWTAGPGVKESRKFLEDQAKKGPIYVGFQGTFGLMPYGYEIYFRNNKNITTRGFYPVNEVPNEALENSKVKPTYFVFYQPCPSCKSPGFAPASWSYPEVFSFKKNEDIYLKIYKIE